MTSNAPGPCCVVGVKHDGEANGQIETVGNGILYACFINRYGLDHIQLTANQLRPIFPTQLIAQQNGLFYCSRTLLGIVSSILS